METIKTLYKVELLKNVSESFEDDDLYVCIAHGNIVDKNGMYDEYQRMLNTAYDDIVSGKMTFDNIPHFSTSYIESYDRSEHHNSIRYIVNGNHDEVNMVYCHSIPIEFNDDNTIVFDDSYVVSEFNGKLYLVCVDSYLDNNFGSVVMEFDKSISEEDLINSVTAYMKDIYNRCQ